MKKPQKPKPPTIQQLEQQKRQAYSQGNIELAKKIQRELDYFYWGLK